MQAEPTPTGRMRYARTFALTALALLAFAANSVLCRMALREAAIDPVAFTVIRLASGAAALWLLVRLRGGAGTLPGSWRSALALLAYAAGFSFAYLSLTAATGALLLFGAVQATMVMHGLWAGERLRAWQWCGVAIASTGVVVLLLPGFSAPPLHGALLMLGAGVAWGVYSLRGRGEGDPTAVTAGNFVRTLPAVALLAAWALRGNAPDAEGVAYSVASGALTSGIGYAIWYAVLPSLRASTAATVQLSVPVLVALGGVLLLAEPVTLRLALATVAVVGGIALVVRTARRVS